MPLATWIQTAFNGGEWTPLLWGRIELEKRRIALSRCLNFLPTLQGALVRRSGTWLVDNPFSGTTPPGVMRLQRFEFSTEQAYVIAFYSGYVRFYTEDGVLLSSGIPYTISHSYTDAEIWQLNFCQSGDVLYIFHPNHPPTTLNRLAATNWTFTALAFQDGPYNGLNTDTTNTVYSNGSSGPGIILTFASTSGINEGAGFGPSDVGRLIRAATGGATFGWCTITSVTSTTVVVVTVPFGVSFSAIVGSGAATPIWRLGLFYVANYPAVGTFHEDRLCVAACPQAPNRIDGSETSDFLSFTPSSLLDGTVIDSNAIGFALNSNAVDSIVWMASDWHGLLLGTYGGEWMLESSSYGMALSPTSAVARETTRYGGVSLQVSRLGLETFFVQLGSRKVRTLQYQFMVDGFVGNDISTFAEHLTRGGFKQFCIQRTPQQTLWLVRNDGVLVSCTYDHDQQAIAWAEHTLGGSSGQGVSPPTVVSVAVIPAPDLSRDEVWIAVQREGTYAGYPAQLVTIERLSKIWEVGDSAGTWAANSAFLEAAERGVFSTAQTAVIGNLGVFARATNIYALTDGYAQGPLTADSAGNIPLPVAAKDITIGFPYLSQMTTLPIEAGGQNGPAQGKIKRVHRVMVRMFDSLGLTLLANRVNAVPLAESFRVPANPMDAAPPLFTGTRQFAWPGTYEEDGFVTVQTTEPFPLNISTLSAQLETQDGG